MFLEFAGFKIGAVTFLFHSFVSSFVSKYSILFLSFIRSLNFLLISVYFRFCVDLFMFKFERFSVALGSKIGILARNLPKRDSLPRYNS